MPPLPLLLGLLASPLDLDVHGADELARLDGLPVVATIRVATPPDTNFGVTYFGDGQAKGVTLPGEQDVRRGDRVVVVGWVRVVRLPPAVADGVRLPAVAEVRVEGVRWWPLETAGR